MVEDLCADYTAHASRVIAATRQQLRANSLMVLLIQGHNGSVTISDSGGTRQRWRQWNARLGDLCRLHIRNHIRKEIAKLIFDLPTHRVLVGTVEPQMMNEGRAIVLAEATAQGYHGYFGAHQGAPVLDPLQDGGANKLLKYSDHCYFIPVCPATGTRANSGAGTPAGWPAAIVPMLFLPPIDAGLPQVMAGQAIPQPAAMADAYSWLDLNRVEAALKISKDTAERRTVSDMIANMHFSIGTARQQLAETPPQGHSTVQLVAMLQDIDQRRSSSSVTLDQVSASGTATLLAEPTERQSAQRPTSHHSPRAASPVAQRAGSQARSRSPRSDGQPEG